MSQHPLSFIGNVSNSVKARDKALSTRKKNVGRLILRIFLNKCTSMSKSEDTTQDTLETHQQRFLGAVGGRLRLSSQLGS